MQQNEIFIKLNKILPKENIGENVPMAKETTFRAGGCAAFLAKCDNPDQLRDVLTLLKKENIPWFVLGNGSNVLFKDEGFEGVVIKLGKEFSEIVVTENGFIAGAACKLPYLSKLALAYGFEGLEFACGIPGSLGGAIFMNAGAYDGSMKDVLGWVTAVNPDGEIYKYEPYELELSYRHSRFEESGEIILYAEIVLNKGDADNISAKMEDFTKRRSEKQPINLPSAGSFFKRPEGDYAARLIEAAGLKGCSVGDAQVSPLHAGFIVNNGNASANDIIKLSETVSEQVYDKFGIKLEPEVRIIGK